LRLHFDGHLRLEFNGAKVTTDAGLLAVRELDESLGFTGSAGECLRGENLSGRGWNCCVRKASGEISVKKCRKIPT
jgi:hypothetical protein